MQANIKKLKFGFVNSVLRFLDPEDIIAATGFAEKAKELLKNDLGVDIVESAPQVFDRPMSNTAWKLFKTEDVDAVVLFNGTFNTGEGSAEIIRNLEVPYLLWGIEEFAIERHNFTGSLVGALPQASMFANFGQKFSFVYGSDVKSPAVNRKVRAFVNAVRAISHMKQATIGIIGWRADGFEFSGFDELAIKKKFGATMTKVSMHDFISLSKNIDEKDVDEDMKIQQKIFDISKENLEEARGLSKVYLATKKIVEERNLQSYVPDCWPLRDEERTCICPANGRMLADGIMASCEGDVDGSLTLMMEYAMTFSTPWYGDLLNYLKEKEALIFWHCGNGPYNMASSKPRIDRVFSSIAEISSSKAGIATIARLNSIRGQFTIHAGVGEVIDNEQYLKGSNLTIKMKNGNMKFIESMIYNGIPHHNGVVYGDIIDEIKEFGNLMNIPVIIP